MKEFSVQDNERTYSFYFENGKLERMVWIDRASRTIVLDEYRTLEAFQKPISIADFEIAVAALCNDRYFESVVEFLSSLQEKELKTAARRIIASAIKDMTERSAVLSRTLADDFALNV